MYEITATNGIEYGKDKYEGMGLNRLRKLEMGPRELPVKARAYWQKINTFKGFKKIKTYSYPCHVVSSVYNSHFQPIIAGLGRIDYE